MAADFTDVMVYVDAVEATRALFEEIGFTYDSEGEGWIGLKHAPSHQRFVLTTIPFGSRWAIALSTDDVSATVKTFSLRGNPVASIRRETVEYATMEVAGIPLLIHRR